jgi:hypothetical protein
MHSTPRKGKTKTATQSSRPHVTASPHLNPWILLTAFGLAALGLVYFPFAHYGWSDFQPLSHSFSQTFWTSFFILLGILASILYARYIPTQIPLPSHDLDQRITYPLLVTILAFGAYLRLFHLGHIPSIFASDTAIEILNPLNILERNKYQLVFLPGPREPFYVYYLALFINLFPNQPLYVAQQIAAASMDLFTIGILYFLGRELGGRRAGLLAVALGAINRTLLEKTVLNLRFLTLPTAVALTLLLSIRIIRKPTPVNFMLWALGMTWGISTYTGFRPYVPCFAFMLLAWVFTHVQERKAYRLFTFPLALSLGLLVFISLWTSGFFGMDIFFPLKFNWITYFLLIMAASFFHLWVKWMHPPSIAPLLRNWMTWVTWTLCLGLPILVDFWITNHVAAQRPQLQILSSAFLTTNLPHLFESLIRTFKTFWLGGVDIFDYSVSGDAFLDFPSAFFLILGLFFLARRITWPVLLTTAALLVGLVTDVLSAECHSGKLLGAIVPSIVLGAWGLSFAYETGLRLGGQRVWRLAAGLITVGILGWGAWANFHRAYGDWAFSEGHTTLGVRFARQVQKDESLSTVFFANTENLEKQFGVLCVQEALGTIGHPVRTLQDENLLVVRPGQALLSPVILYRSLDISTIERIRKEYPEAEWTDVYRNLDTPLGGPPLIGRILIPAHLLSDQPGKLFRIIHAPTNGWVRNFYEGYYGMARGLIQWQDWAPSLHSPLPNLSLDGTSVRWTGQYYSGEKKLELLGSPSRNNKAYLSIDHKKLLYWSPGNRWVEKKYVLEKAGGPHIIDLTVCFQNGPQIPVVQYRLKDSSSATELDSLTTNEP